jgi:acyl carrier protein
LNEGSQNNIFATLTFGLLDGWWLYEDEHLRIPGSPLLYPATWQKILEEEGFQHIHFPVEAAHAFGQQIIIAESDGIVRQKVQNEANEGKLKSSAEDRLLIQVKTINDELKHSQIHEEPLSAQTIVEAVMSSTEVMNESIEEYVQSIVLEQLSKSIKVARRSIDCDVAFSDYGVDSIIGVNFVKQLNDAIGINLNTAILFDYTTAGSLTNYIIKIYKEEIKKRITLLSQDIPSQKRLKNFEDLFESGISQIKDNDNNVLLPQDNEKFIELLEADFFENELSTESLIAAVLGEISKGE